MKALAEGLRSEVSRAAREAVRETSAKLAALVAEKTPIRTGRLKAGWQVSSTPASNTKEPENETPGRPGEAEAATAYVVNFTPYALQVELGDLGRPGRYMASRAVEELQGELSRNLAARLGRVTLSQRSDTLDSEPFGQPVEPEEIAGNASGDGPDRKRSGP